MSNQINEFLNVLSKMGITYNKIHKNTGISKMNLSKWRKGNSKPNQDSLLKLRDLGLEVLTRGGLNFPLKKEFREPVENFCRYVEEILRDMPKKNDKESIILSEHRNNKEALDFLKPALDFGLFDSYLNSYNMNGFILDKNRKIERKIEKQYQPMFVVNFNLLIDFIDKNSEKDVEDFVEKGWKRERAEEFYSNCPHEEDYEKSEGISSIPSLSEYWLAKELKVSNTQIRNWKSGKDFPTEENLANLKKLLHLNGKIAFLGYKFSDWEFEGMFLPNIGDKLRKQDEDCLYQKTLEFFTNVLFFYCDDISIIKQLKNDMEESLTEEVQGNLVSAFFQEFHNLKISREIIADEDTYKILPDLVSYFQMSDQQVNYILGKDKELLSQIFTKENIKILRQIFDKKCFSDEQREQLGELISVLEQQKGVHNPFLRFRSLYSKDNHSQEDIETITNQLALLLTVPSISKWFHSEYSFESLTDKELRDIRGFAKLALLDNNQELREKVTKCTAEKMENETDNRYNDLIMFFIDLSNPSVIQRIFERK